MSDPCDTAGSCVCPADPQTTAVAAGWGSADRLALIRQAFRLEWASIGWMLIEAAVAFGAGLAAGSLSLAAFGLDSVIELASALVLIWRLHAELRLGASFPERTERLASRIGGGLLFALAGFIVIGSGWSLWTRHAQEFSVPGLAVTALAIPVMSVLARGKLKVATQLGSGALRADAMESSDVRLALFRRRPGAAGDSADRSLVGRFRGGAGHRLVRGPRGP